MNELEQLKRDNEVLYLDNVALSETADRLREALEGLLEYLAECTTRDGCPVCVARSALEVKP